MSINDRNSNKKKCFYDKEEEKPPKKKQKLLEISKNKSKESIKILRNISAQTKIGLTRNNSTSVRNPVSSVSVKKAKARNRNGRNVLIKAIVPSSKAKKRNLSSQSTDFQPKNKKINAPLSIKSIAIQNRVQRRKIFPIHNKLIKIATLSSKAKKRNLLCQSTVSTQKNKRAKTSFIKNSAHSSSNIKAKILPTTKLRSSSNISDIRKRLFSLENSIERHNSKSSQKSKAKSRNQNQPAPKYGISSSSVKQNSLNRKFSKVSIKIKKSTVGKAGEGAKKNQANSTAKQKGKEKKVTKEAHGDKRRPRKNKVTYLVTIHPIGRKIENVPQQEVIDLTTNTEHEVQSERGKESTAEPETYTTASPSETTGEESNIETVLATTSSNSLAIDESSNVDHEVANSDTNTESRSEAEIQIDLETTHIDQQIDSPTLNAESQTPVNPRKVSSSLSVNISKHAEANIEYERTKSLNIYTQKDSPEAVRITGGDETSSNDTEASTGLNSPPVTEAQNEKSVIQNKVSASKSRKVNLRKVNSPPNQTRFEEPRIRTRCIKPKEFKRRMPSQTIGPFLYRFLYRALYGTEDDD